MALDLETTGLDPKRDTIMEIGAVRFRTSLNDGMIEGKVLDKWQQLVNPGGLKTIHIQQLTGIRPEEVRHAPRFSQVIDQLHRFAGNYPVVGHNVSFDM